MRRIAFFGGECSRAGKQALQAGLLRIGRLSARRDERGAAQKQRSDDGKPFLETHALYR
jgi:hypothetical protein